MATTSRAGNDEMRQHTAQIAALESSMRVGPNLCARASKPRAPGPGIVAGANKAGPEENEDVLQAP